MSTYSDIVAKFPGCKPIYLSTVTAGKEYPCWESLAYYHGLTWSGSTGSSVSAISVTHSASVSLTDEFTLELWFEMGTETNSGLISKGTDGYGNYSLIYDSTLKFRVAIAGGQFEVVGPALVNGTTYHIAATYSTSGGYARIWVDGSSSWQRACSDPAVANTDNVKIGNYYNGSYGLTSGTVYDVRISSVCRYSTTFTPETSWEKDSATVLLFTMEDNSNTVDDHSDNSNDGTLQTPANLTWVTPYSYYRTPETSRVTSVYYNGTSLAATTDFSAAGWLWDGSYLYVGGGSFNPNSYYMLGILTFYFSTEPKNLNGHYWEPRIKEIPKISLRIEKEFGTLGQVGSACITFSNDDGFFDDFLDLHWDAGNVDLYLGIDAPGTTMAYSDYQQIGSWVNDNTKVTSELFELNLLEAKSRTKKQIPISEYTRTTYPSLIEDEIGNPIPIIYGTVYGARAVCINTSTNLFKVAGHAVTRFIRVRQMTSSSASVATITYEDLAKAEFVISGWDGSSAVSVDLEGKPDANGYLMSNPSDIIKDILATIGETNLDSTSFTEAKNYWDLGYVIPDSLNRVCSVNPSIYIGADGFEDCFTVLGDICALVSAYLYSDSQGRYRLVAFKPLPGNALTKVTDSEILSWEQNVQAGTENSKMILSYSMRHVDEWGQSVTVERATNQYRQREPVSVNETADLNLSNTDEATDYGNERLYFNRKPIKTYTVKVPNVGLALRPADQIHIVSAQRGIDGIFEILEWEPSPDKNEVQLIVGDLHGVADTAAWYGAASGNVFPSSLGGGSVDSWSSGWTNSQKTWARQNFGYFAGTDGFSSASPTGALDYATSTWGR